MAETYGAMGVHIATLLLGLIAIDETMGPILFRRGLQASGEVAATEDGEE